MAAVGAIIFGIISISKYKKSYFWSIMVLIIAVVISLATLGIG